MKSAALWTIPLCAMVALPMNAQNNKQNNKGKQREKQEVVAKSGEGSDTNLGKANNMMLRHLQRCGHKPYLLVGRLSV